MEYLGFILLFLLLLVLVLALTIRRVIIFEYQRGLLYRNGKYVRLLGPGVHTYFRLTDNINRVDMRSVHVTIAGQEVLTSDNVGIKISLVTGYKVVDPYKAVNTVANYAEALYLRLQLALRDLVGGLEVDDLLARRDEIARQLFERTAPQAAELGLELELVNMRDIMFPGELKNIFAQVVNARKEGLASLERARGESAALRNLANAARLLDNNPNLRSLRLYQVLEKGKGNTIVLMAPDGKNGLSLLDTPNPDVES